MDVVFMICDVIILKEHWRLKNCCKYFANYFLKIFLFIVNLVAVQAFTSLAVANTHQFYLESSNSHPVRGEEFSLVFGVIPSSDANLSVFRLKINFDQSVLKYTGIYSDNNVHDFKTNLSGNTLNVIFLTSEKGLEVKKSVKSELLEISFKTLSGAPAAKTDVYAEIDGMANYDLERIYTASDRLKTEIMISEIPKVNCNLRSLTAENYTLYPSFSGDITQYKVTVPSKKDELLIKAVPQDPDAKITINKTLLNSPGRTTAITVTVLGSDEKSKKSYKVTVNRLKASIDKDNRSAKNFSGSKTTNSGSKDSNLYRKSVIKNQIFKTEEDKNNESCYSVCIVRNHFRLSVFLVIIMICMIILVLIMRSKDTKNPTLDPKVPIK